MNVRVSIKLIKKPNITVEGTVGMTGQLSNLFIKDLLALNALLRIIGEV